MDNGQSFEMEGEFAGLDLNSGRLEARFVRAMNTPSAQPGKSIWARSESRAEASETRFPQPYTGRRATKSWTSPKYRRRAATRQSGE